MDARSTHRSDLSRFRHDWAALRFEWAMLKLQLALKQNFNPLQPRNPAGSEGAGRWTLGGNGPVRVATSQEWKVLSEKKQPDGSLAEQTVMGPDGTIIRAEYPVRGPTRFDDRYTVRTPDGTVRIFENVGSVQTIYDGEGRKLSEVEWTRNGPEPVARVQETFVFLAPAVPAAFNATIVAVGALYVFLSINNGPNRQAVLSYPAQKYDVPTPTSPAIFAGYLTNDEVSKACGAYKEAQAFLDDATIRIRKEDYSSKATYGTAVHMETRNLMRATPVEGLHAEISFLKTLDETGEPPNFAILNQYYGRIGSMRMDIFDVTRPTVACVYDIKTGKSGLPPARMNEIATTTRLNYPQAQQIIVTEMRSAY
ncbi:hypothetical protein [Terrarubrum flagellatum]|uniref:hypothetical protein n=1 Tax=Terrirubrum flagellatum TaxID=2895980 RepID=UPI003144E5E6